MRILFITNNLPPLVDGVGDYTYNIAREFSKNQHEVYIVCRNNPDINACINGIKVFPVINDWKCDCYKPIIKIIKENDIDTVSLQYVPHGFHVKGLPFPLIRLTKEIKKCNVKLFTFCHETYVEAEKGNIKRTLLSHVMRYIIKQIVRHSDYVATSIEYYQNIISNLSSKKKDVFLVPISSNVPETDLSKKGLRALKEKLTDKDGVIISFFGLRNIQTSIEAISELKKEGHKIKILLIGKLPHNLPDSLPEDTIKTGVLDIKEIGQYLKVSDIFILPQDSRYGCSFKSGALIAAMKAGIAIISSKGKLTSPLLVHRKNIIFTEFTDCIKIKNSILSVIYSQDLYSLGNNIRKVANGFTWHNVYMNYISILKNDV